MRKIIRGEGIDVHVLLDTSADVCLYNGHSNVGPSQNRWIALYAHAYKDNPKFIQYYLGHFTLWQNERDYIQELTFGEAKKFAHEHLDDMSPVEEALCAEYGLLDVDTLQ